jgi:hypothetical protein
MFLLGLCLEPQLDIAVDIARLNIFYPLFPCLTDKSVAIWCGENATKNMKQSNKFQSVAKNKTKENHFKVEFSLQFLNQG